uniref:Uncharacterized protein n=1 Tax=viral metagenome TaxID=1070528 RepID=A0A6C0EDJ6_9ZZZZ
MDDYTIIANSTNEYITKAKIVIQAATVAFSGYDIKPPPKYFEGAIMLTNEEQLLMIIRAKRCLQYLLALNAHMELEYHSRYVFIDKQGLLDAGFTEEFLVKLLELVMGVSRDYKRLHDQTEIWLAERDS